MNERIQQLAEQAGWDNHHAKFDTRIENFALLIVEECADVCESMPLIGPYKEVQDATLKDASVQIREHFGVEE
jgi:hypothetical protein